MNEHSKALDNKSSVQVPAVEPPAETKKKLEEGFEHFNKNFRETPLFKDKVIETFRYALYSLKKDVRFPELMHKLRDNFDDKTAIFIRETLLKVHFLKYVKSVFPN